MSGEELTGDVVLYGDGKYRWIYEKSLYGDRTILLLVMRVILISWLVLFLFLLFLAVSESSDIAGTLTVSLIVLAVLMGLCVVGYFLYAAIMGGKYCVVFAMDDAGVLHAQQSAQADKARLLGELTAIAGAATGNLTTTGVGLTSTRTQKYTSFKDVRSINVDRGHDTIHLGGNQVYVTEKDMDFVLDFIKERCPKAEVKGV